MTVPVKTSRTEGGAVCSSTQLAGSSTLVSFQMPRPSGGPDASGISEPIRRGTQVIADADPATTRANANRQSRLAPVVVSGTYSPRS